MRKNNKKGFTLVELLVVIAILAILASVAVVGYTAFVDKAKVSKAETELHQIVEYVNAEFMDDGKWGTLERTETDGVVSFDGAALTTAIQGCEDLGNPTNVTVANDGTVTYTYDGGSVTANLR